jgi:hypothetical protein
MGSDLLELLRRQEIVHPTRIVAVEAGHRRLRLTIAGYPWWRTTERAEDGQVVFLFEGIEEGLLDVQTLLDFEEDEALEFVNVSPLSQHGWADGGTSFATYCSEPLPEPLALYAVVEDYLWDAGAPRSARDYLNIQDGSLARFCALTRASSYLVARAPEHLHRLVEAELARQHVAHNVIAHERPMATGLFVQIGGTSLVCESATVEV